jgi:hypothetical protein
VSIAGETPRSTHVMVMMMENAGGFIGNSNDDGGVRLR